METMHIEKVLYLIWKGDPAALNMFVNSRLGGKVLSVGARKVGSRTAFLLVNMAEVDKPEQKAILPFRTRPDEKEPPSVEVAIERLRSCAR